jgi:hypothetical protein
MNAAYESIDSAINEADRLLRALRKSGTLQVRSSEEKGLAKATAFAWFNNHRHAVALGTNGSLLSHVDDCFKFLLSASDRATSRSMYIDALKSVKKALSDVRERVLVGSSSKITHTPDNPPDLSLVVPDPRMKAILSNRWHECTKCISIDAPLAATVMMGGLLEALLLARINKEVNKSRIFKAASAPRSKKDGSVLPLNEWGLRDYLDVSHELGWISRSGKDVGEVLRDYRNYIHPYKEFSHDVQIDKHDAGLFWEITKGILRQLIEKTK